MNTTLKVFIVLVMLAAMAFAWIQMTLYATRENWKRRWNQDTTELTRDLKTATTKLATESADKVKALELTTRLEDQISQLQKEKKDLEASITQKDASTQLVKAERDKAMTDLAARDEHIQTLSHQLELARTRNNELNHIASVARGVAHQLNLKLAEVEDDLHNTSTALDKAKQDLVAEKKENNDNKARLALLLERHPKIHAEIVDEKASAKFVQGIVAAVNTNHQGQQDLVMLTIGKDEGIEEGMEFIIFRGNQYIVKVRAEKVLNDMVAARVIPETWNAAGALIQVNDLAQNRL